MTTKAPAPAGAHNHHQPPPMDTEPDYGFRESVMDYADQNQNLSDSCVRQLLAEHSTSLSQFLEDGYKGGANHAPSLLDWLGY